MADRQVDRRLRRRVGRLSALDVAVVGGGIVGVSAAAFLAEAGAAVGLFERHEVGSAASGRNSGSVQHPFDSELVWLHRETLAIYRDLGLIDGPPAGVLTLAASPEPLGPLAADMRHAFPELGASLIEGPELSALEPSLAPGLAACRLETGYPLRPAAATQALAARARQAGAVLHEGATATVAVGRGRVSGVAVEGELHAADAVLVAAGPWTPLLVNRGGQWRPIEPVWGAVAEVALERPPRQVLEEAGVEGVVAGEVGSLFSLVTADGASGVGSTFTADEPDAGALAPGLLAAGAAFVPELEHAKVVAARACARPQSRDGRPLIGPLPAAEGLYVAAGHGPWGISLGAASGALAAGSLLGDAEIPPPLRAARFS
ncbi:MAG TPA: FAD-binding oxidoreductase [Thermoleophilaceae bacterium]|nr:FAD-binding oxidoreductase [Thermoleophilaceae bacterium]